MRVLAAVLVVVGCGGDASSPDSLTDSTKVPLTRLDLPRVDEPARVMVIAGAKPAAVVWIGATGKLEVGKAGPSWGGLAAKADRTRTDLEGLRHAVLEAIVATNGPAATGAAGELASETNPDTVATRRARRAGLIGARGSDDKPGPGRLASARAIPIETIHNTSPLVIALPATPATAVARVLEYTGGALAVDHAGSLAVLVRGFARRYAPSLIGQASWVEVFADAKGLHFVTQPDERESLIEWNGAALDRAALATALAASPATHVDVLVREDTTTQTLVDMLVALDALGATHVAVAEARGTPSERRAQIAAARLAAVRTGSASTATVVGGQLDSQGDLDKAVIREHVQRALPAIKGCYEAQVAVRPDLAGTVATQFFITPTGSVFQADASGVDAKVASCIAAVLKTLKFPPSVGGGGVQVNYPFTFQQAP